MLQIVKKQQHIFVVVAGSNRPSALEKAQAFFGYELTTTLQAALICEDTCFYTQHETGKRNVSTR